MLAIYSLEKQPVSQALTTLIFNSAAQVYMAFAVESELPSNIYNRRLYSRILPLGFRFLCLYFSIARI